MPWDELKPRKFAAFEKELDGISRQTMEDHYKLYEGYAKKANECRRILNEFDYSRDRGQPGLLAAARGVGGLHLRAAGLQEPRPLLRPPRR